MRWFASCYTIALVLLGGSAAHARTLDIISTGDDIISIRDLEPDEAVTLGFHSLGYRYQTFGFFGLDVWRWGGEFVAYKTAPEPAADELHALGDGTIVVDRWMYAALSDAGLETLGAPHVPWKYRCPPGLLLILALIELWLLARRRRSIRLVLAIGGGLLALAAVLYAGGVDQAFAIPLLLGLYHVGVGWLAIRRHRDEADAAAGPDEPAGADEPANAPARKPRPRPPESRTPRPVGVHAGPFRAPPQPAPLAVEYPPTAPSTTSVVVRPESEADGKEPKHLR